MESSYDIHNVCNIIKSSTGIDNVRNVLEKNLLLSQFVILDSVGAMVRCKGTNKVSNIYSAVNDASREISITAVDAVRSANIKNASVLVSECVDSLFTIVPIDTEANVYEVCF